MKKIIAIILCLSMTLALFCPCDNTETQDVDTTPGYLKHEIIEETYLTLENSNIVINPEGSIDGKNLGLDIGIADEKGEVYQIFEDVMFVLENNNSNKNAEIIWEPKYFGDDKNVRYSPKLIMEESAEGVTMTNSAQTNSFKMIDYIHFDSEKDYIIKLNVGKINLGTLINTEDNVPGWELSGTIKYDVMGEWHNKSPNIVWMPPANFQEEGIFYYNVSDMVRNHLEVIGYKNDNTDIALLGSFDVKGENTSINLKEFQIFEVDRGYNASENEVSRKYFTDGIESSVAYNYGTEIQTFDYYSNEYTVARKLTKTSDGTIGLCGKVDGAVSYDGTKYAVIAEYNGIKYAVTTNEKQRIEFYNSEEDIANRIFTELPTANTKYWVIPCTDLHVGETIYMAVCADVVDTAVNLVETARKAIDISFRVK